MREAAPTLIARVETHWHAPWLIGALSHQGTGHYAEGKPNQDAFAIGSEGRTTWLALADGVSTKPFSHEGSNLAVRYLGEALTEALRNGAPASAHVLTGAYTHAHKRLALHARACGQPLNAFACTLLSALITDKAITVGKIGDGSVLGLENHRDGAALVPLLDTPHIGEGVVEFTHPQWLSQLCIRHIADRHKAGIGTLALCSDGADPYFFKATGDTTRRAILNPDRIGINLRDGVGQRGVRNAIGYFASLMFLRPHVDESDDKTLIVATIPAEAPPC